MVPRPAKGGRLGAYELLVRIGKGGMGEVWKAHDPRLNREIAIKFSDEQFTDRFEREARAIAALNHPNICTLFDVGPNYLVMELIDGPTLADRIAEGPIPLEEALAIAKQIADALEAAHEKNIVHRDLKPGNIKLRPDGSVKVLDFGLAKSGLPGAEVSHDSPTLSLVHSPTTVGVILGTAAYMAPEQARGKTVDKRADIWSFGVVLHEMLTGKRAFEGEDLADTLASVVKSEPDLTVIPHRVRRLLAKCLQKDPKKRLRDIADAWDYLDAPAAPVTDHSRSRFGMGWVVAGVLALALAALALAALAFLHLRGTPPETKRVQFTLDPPSGNQYTNLFGGVAVSPDGRYLVFTAAKGNEPPRIWLRPIGSLDARPLPGTEGGNFPFWSPDGKSLAFFSRGDNKLERIDIAGGSPIVIADAPWGAGAGGTWNADGIILFASTAGLRRVAASGGASSLLTIVNLPRRETLHSHPQFLPGGKTFLYFITSSDSSIRGVYAASLDRPQGRTRILAADSKAIYAAGHEGQPAALLWLQDQTLMAQAFDAGHLRFAGDPVRVAEGIASPGPNNPSALSFDIGRSQDAAGGRASFWASDSGLLMYFGGNPARNSKLVWTSRDGKRLEEAAPEDRYESLDLSPDGKRVVFARSDSGYKTDVWIYDLGRKVSTRLTFSPNERIPVWSPDGRYIVYDSDRGGVRQLFRKEASGGGREERLTSGPDNKFATDWSPDGKYIVFDEFSPGTGQDLWALPADADASGERTPVPLLQTPFAELHGRVSPDGKWLAYQSNESGKDEIYVRTFPSGGEKFLVSNGGGTRPVWRNDGREVFYNTSGAPTRLMAASVRLAPAGLEVGTPHELFAITALLGNSAKPWDVSADGQRFLIEEQTGAAQQLTVVQNWWAGLKK
ncbi:MAG TPA: protein kinase [Bryobacteraceae bacterium]|nr:protein kinase [Bryobacteraceae bacterium]